MITISNDEKAISDICNHPKVFDWISDDCSPKPYVPVMHDSILYLMDESLNGVIQIEPFNGICVQVHIAVKPEMRGKAKDFVIESMEWGFTNLRIMKVITLVPEYNRLGARLAIKCGFDHEGVVKNSFLKNWKLHDQLLFGITKTQFLEGRQSCQQE